jgi:hypothetical protein
MVKVGKTKMDSVQAWPAAITTLELLIGDIAVSIWSHHRISLSPYLRARTTANFENCIVKRKADRK